jgi:hypothetical protein
MDAITDERPLDARGRTLLYQPSPHIPICKINELQIPTSCCGQCNCPDDDVGETAGNEIPTRQCAHESFWCRREQGAHHLRFDAHVDGTAVRPGPAAASGGRQQTRQFVRRPQVTVMAERQPCTASIGSGAVAGAANAFRHVVANHPHASVTNPVENTADIFC